MPSVVSARRPRAVARALTGAALAVTFGNAARASAQVQLSGAALFQLDPGTKAYVPTNAFLPLSTNPAAGVFGSTNDQMFLGANGLGSLANNPRSPITLNVGLNTFTFASPLRVVSATDLVGLSLFLGAAPTAPGLTGYNVRDAAASAVQGAPGAIGYDPYTGAVAGAANSAFLAPDAGLVGTIGGFAVALTGFQFAETNIGYVQPGGVNATPSDCGTGACNWIGTFQITVTPLAGPPGTTVPEPATYALLAAGLAGVGLAARRRVTPG